MCAELKDHNLLLVVSRKLMKGRRDNFVIYRLDKDMTLEACYKTFGELDEDFGHCIRAYGTAEGSKTYTEDKFLPFSSHLGRLKIK